MYCPTNGAHTLPRGFRFHHEEGPKTPEPLSVDEPRQPSPPRPRLKVRRRNASTLQAPTQQFLASVAAEDIPIPTIEIPRMPLEDSVMVDREETSADSGLLAPQPYTHRFTSPPKTPLLMQSFEEAASRRPDWSMMTPEPPQDYFTRPVSSMSNASDTSDDSLYSGSRASRPSDDGSCTSPESEAGDPFQFPIIKGKGKAISYESVEQDMPLNGQLRSKHRKDAAWTHAQSAHLWSTYNVYLQDPTVTPFRIGASTVPPEGVCHRVAREARRSWKGPKTALPTRPSRVSSNSSRESEKSGSVTPKGDLPKVYCQWPHSSSATRTKLRAMCKANNSAVSRHQHLQTRSPTPFTNQNRLRTPEPTRMGVNTFSTKDIALSLTTSTAESMQPDGPLAKLATDSLETPTPATFPPLEEYQPLSIPKSRSMGSGITEFGGRRLGSPFVARTYGPSSSKNLHPYDNRPSPPRSQSDVLGPSLRSPVRFDKPRSLNSTQKRRAQHDLEEELSPSGAIVRPSILNEQLFGTPFTQRRVRSRGFSLGDEALLHRSPGIFQSSTSPDLRAPPKMEIITPEPNSSAAPRLLPPANISPRLGSPFSESGNNTFPRRLPSDGTSTIRRSAFATMHQTHQTRRSIESFDFGEGPSLQSRLEQLDMKLKQIREREATSKRQSSE
ncbi:uncharacterized protein PAC_00132 [Phialocephala subalpina]|uniref:Uncharacterized protein n=1 Tax=Phialocephala subalpina TaxID=576137 RepID=A0A1L7WBW3_9HELO|nr:uncharacterized protein PAC_00132 [Phialocephala subalpina]